MKVHVTTRPGVDIVWADGHASHYDFAYLREQCPCAICDDQRQKEQRIASPSRPDSAAAELPMFKPRPGARAAKTVGHYALQIDFTDGHTAGIFSYELSAVRICPCPQCESSFRRSAS